MNKVYQKITYLHPQYGRMAGIGDCHAAAIASILKIQLESIPAKIRILPRGRTFNEHRIILNNWLKERFGLEIVPYDRKVAEQYGMLDRRYYIASVQYPSSYHSIVGYSGSLVHDPSPDINRIRSTSKWYPGHYGIRYYDFFSKTQERELPYYGRGGTYIEKRLQLQFGPTKEFYYSIDSKKR